jgi:CubicO group peptidase (beta-lactamase class C family)
MRVAGWAFLIGALLPAAASGQLNEKWGVPGSPTGQAVAVVLEMIDCGDPAYVRSMVAERFDPEFVARVPMSEHVSVFQRLHDDLPGVTPGGLRRTPEGAELALRGDSGRSARIQLRVTEAGRIAGLRVLEIEGPSATAGLPLEDRLERWAASGAFSGVVYRTRDGQRHWARAYGVADRDHGVPNTEDTRFNIGSLTKAFTGAAVLMLWEEGELELDDPIGRHLDGFPPEIAGSVTIRHLLTHTSGWGHYWDNDAFRSNLVALRDLDHYLAFIRDIPLDFEPGTDRQYSNVGFEVLGAIVEAASGQSYYDFVRERVFAPLGMHDSGFFPRDRPTPRRAIGYTTAHPHADGQPMENTLLLGPVGTPAGGSYSTAADLARFWSAMLGYELLGETASHMAMGDYREGEEKPGPNVYGGGGPGVRAAVVVVPGRRSIDVVLVNIDTPVLEELTAALETAALTDASGDGVHPDQ